MKTNAEEILLIVGPCKISKSKILYNKLKINNPNNKI